MSDMFDLGKIYGVPVYVHDFAQDDCFRPMQDQIFDGLEKTKYQKMWDSQNISDPPFGQNWLKDNGCDIFLNEIQSHVTTYFTEYCKCPDYKYSMLNAWVTENNKGDYGPVHNHGADSDIAGTYYYLTSGNDGDFFFLPPLAGQSIFLPSTHQALEIPPVLGRLILFPAWVNHGVRTNTTNNTRLSISFNLRINL